MYTVTYKGKDRIRDFVSDHPHILEMKTRYFPEDFEYCYAPYYLEIIMNAEHYDHYDPGNRIKGIPQSYITGYLDQLLEEDNQTYNQQIEEEHKEILDKTNEFLGLFSFLNNAIKKSNTSLQ